MTEKKSQTDRIPYETLTDANAVSSWLLPDVNNKGRVVISAKREKNLKNGNQANEIIEDYKKPGKPKPLTVEELKQMAEEAKKEGYDQGYIEGLNKGTQDGLNKGKAEGKNQAYQENKQALDEQIIRFAAMCDSLMQPMLEQEEALETLLVDMATHFAEELIGRELKTSPQYLFDIINKALLALPVGVKNISVYLNEKDAVLVQQHLPKQQRNWIIKVDESIKTGGCRVETLESLIDYTVQHRMQKFIQDVRQKGDISSDKVAPPTVQREQTGPNSAEDDHADRTPKS